jgi:hypothetical protein
VLTIALVTLLLATTAAAAKRPLHRFPHWWYLQAVCVHRGESHNWRIVNPPYAGGFQFMLSTYNRVGGRDAGSLSDLASHIPNEQYFHAWLVWKQDGGSWREWPNTSRACGLR